MRNYITILLFTLLSSSVFGQPYKTIKIFKPYKWMFGVHWHAVEDDGNKFGNIFDVNNSWNALPYPAKITADKYFKYGWSIEMAASYTQYTRTKTINDSTGIEAMFFAFDVNGKYSFYTRYYPRAKWIDPYLTFGVGYTYRNANVAEHTPTVNLGAGINFWVKNFGIQLHSSAKAGVYPGFWEMDNHENYLQHSIGLVYRITDPVHSNGAFGSKKYGWAKKNKRYKKKSGH